MKLWHDVIHSNLYFPDEVIEGNAPLSVLDIAEELGKDNDDDEVDDKGKEGDKDGKGNLNKEDKEVKDNEGDGEEDEEIKLVEEEKIETDEDDIEDVINPLSRKELLKKYPEIFKDFPQLEKGYYANQQYREIFPTLADAREANERLEEFGNIEKELKGGSSVTLFTNLRESDPNAFATMVDTYLPNLQQVDQNAYYHVIGNVIKTTVARMGKMATSKKDDDLMTAAKILNEWAFGEEEYTPPTKFATEKPAERTQLEKDREEYETSKLGDNQKEVDSQVNRVITDTVEKFIDPNERLTGFAKKAAVREAVDRVNELLKKDKPLKQVLEKMWKTAKENKFSPDSVGKIRRATQERAKVLLPHVIKKVRADALKGVERRKADDKDRKGPLPNTGKTSTSRTNNGGRSTNNDGEKKKIPDNMSTLDYFNQD